MWRREINKYNKQNCEPSWIYLRDYTGIHGQQNKIRGYIYCILHSTQFEVSDDRLLLGGNTSH